MQISIRQPGTSWPWAFGQFIALAAVGVFLVDMGVAFAIPIAYPPAKYLTIWILSLLWAALLFFHIFELSFHAEQHPMFERNNPKDRASERPISNSATHVNRATFTLPWVYESMGAQTDRGPTDSSHRHDSTSTGRLVRANSTQSLDHRANVNEGTASTSEESDEEASSSHTPVQVRTSFRMRNNMDYAPESNNLRREQQRHEHHAHIMEVRPRRPFQIYVSQDDPETSLPPTTEEDDTILNIATPYSQVTTTSESGDSDSA